jgi:hypothetical protein
MVCILCSGGSCAERGVRRLKKRQNRKKGFIMEIINKQPFCVKRLFGCLLGTQRLLKYRRTPRKTERLRRGVAACVAFEPGSRMAALFS